MIPVRLVEPVRTYDKLLSISDGLVGRRKCLDGSRISLSLEAKRWLHQKPCEEYRESGQTPSREPELGVVFIKIVERVVKGNPVVLRLEEHIFQDGGAGCGVFEIPERCWSVTGGS